jgi:beta-aspartyl-peptidase (threonine type)
MVLRPALIIHGGAGAADSGTDDARRAGCAAALDAGWRVLAGGGDALAAVCAAVAVMEDDPVFNAGVGSCLTSAGTVEMDASVMDGRELRAGAVAVVRSVRHPVQLARAVMEHTAHVMLAGPEADAFARACGVPTCTPEDLVTPRQQDRWRRAAGAAGTVGAAAVDRHGHTAAATSTGGVLNKRPGRVGDSALVGAGTYADDRRGAASASGAGEAIVRVVLAKSVVDLMVHGTAPASAAHQALALLDERVKSTAGIIVVDPLGRIGWAHTTPYMTVGYRCAGSTAPVVLA